LFLTVFNDYFFSAIYLYNLLLTTTVDQRVRVSYLDYTRQRVRKSVYSLAQTNHKPCLTWASKYMERNLLLAFHQAVRSGLARGSAYFLAHKVRHIFDPTAGGVDSWLVRPAVAND